MKRLLLLFLSMQVLFFGFDFVLNFLFDWDRGTLFTYFTFFLLLYSAFLVVTKLFHFIFPQNFGLLVLLLIGLKFGFAFLFYLFYESGIHPEALSKKIFLGHYFINLLLSTYLIYQMLNSPSEGDK